MPTDEQFRREVIRDLAVIGERVENLAKEHSLFTNTTRKFLFGENGRNGMNGYTTKLRQDVALLQNDLAGLAEEFENHLESKAKQREKALDWRMAFLIATGSSLISALVVAGLSAAL